MEFRTPSFGKSKSTMPLVQVRCTTSAGEPSRRSPPPLFARFVVCVRLDAFMHSFDHALTCCIVFGQEVRRLFGGGLPQRRRLSQESRRALEGWDQARACGLKRSRLSGFYPMARGILRGRRGSCMPVACWRTVLCCRMVMSSLRVLEDGSALNFLNLFDDFLVWKSKAMAKDVCALALRRAYRRPILCALAAIV